MESVVAERRRALRLRDAEEHGILFARVRPGHDAWVVDVSIGGALVETRHRLLPGSAIDLFVQTADRRATIRGLVIRCAVVRVLPASLWYRGALHFDRQLSWLVACPR